MTFDAIIIGAGAAGLFCAAEAGRRGRRILLLEHNAEPGRKILVSGGGRCNFTNRDVRPENFVSHNPHFCKSALARYTPQDFVELVKKHQIEFYEKKLGQLFCRHSAREIVGMLLRECQASKVVIKTGCTVSRIAKAQKFEVETSSGRFAAECLVVATGGISFPKIGASDFGYRIARQFSLKVLPTRPSLVPLILGGENSSEFSSLAGVALPTVAKSGKTSFADDTLFTHRGLSGPAVLQISNYWQPERAVEFDLLPGYDMEEVLRDNRQSKQRLDNFLSRYLPARLADSLCRKTLPRKPLERLSDHEIREIAGALNSFALHFDQTEGYHRAEVTLGGIDTNELSSQTMESKKVSGLYFIGEVVDVTGWLGGYNFQWAWSSGFAAAQAI